MNLSASGPMARLTAAKLVTGLALLAGMMISWNLWFALTRQVPRAPVFDILSPAMVPRAEYLLSSLLVIAIGTFLLSQWSSVSGAAIVIILLLLALLDQTRLQPWVYEYGLLVLVVAAYDGRREDSRAAEFTVSVMQLIVAGLYFWSGMQKLNYTFVHETFPNLLSPLESLLGFHLPHTALALGIAMVELLTGVGLLFRRSRKISVLVAVAMHGAILALLVARGFNSVVWVWNAALIALDLVLFWNCEFTFFRSIGRWRTLSGRSRAIWAVATACVVLPAFSFVGWWDMYLSGALYSGNTEVAVIAVDRQLSEALPPAAQRQIFTTTAGETVLPLQEWSLSEVNVPPYPEMRVYRRIAREVCKSATDRQANGLIVKSRPRIFDGSYEVIHLKCSEL